MWNFLLGYLLARSLVGERAARTGGLIVILWGLLFLFAMGGSFFELFAKSFFKGVEDGLRQWENPREVKRARHRVGKIECQRGASGTRSIANFVMDVWKGRLGCHSPLPLP